VVIEEGRVFFHGRGMVPMLKKVAEDWGGKKEGRREEKGLPSGETPPDRRTGTDGLLALLA